MPERSRAAAPWRAAVWSTIGLVGLVVAVDGALRGDPRHRLAAVALGLGLLLPAILRLARRGGRIARALDRLALSVASFAVGLVLLEVTIRALDLRAFSATSLRPDPVLGHAHVPHLGGLDAWGFRNPSVPAGGVDVLCVGDSQTFGNNLAPEDAYPRQLARRTGAEVYSMSLGGYGPLQYLALAERGLELSPDELVIGLYLGNDLGDAFRFAVLDRWAEFRDGELAYPPLTELEHGDRRSLNLGMALMDGLMARSRVLRSTGERIKRGLRMRGYVRSVEQDAGDPGVQLPRAIATRFTPELRADVLDLERPAIAHGADVTEECLRRIAGLRAPSSAHVLLIRTKEGYYAEWLAAEGRPVPPELGLVLERERAVVARLRRAAEAAGLGWIDATAALTAELGAGRPIYPGSSDGHFDVGGAGVVAEVLRRALELDGS